MKILVINLLRLGDILMLAPVLKGLKHQNGDNELHILINKQFHFVKSLLPWVDKFILLDRKELQYGLGEVDRPIFEALDRLGTTIEFLNREGYDKIVNLTHTKFSGYISGMVNANEKLGVNIQVNGAVSYGNNWYQYMNEQMTSNQEQSAHFLDVHYYGSGLSFRPHEYDFKITDKGEEEAQSILNGADDFICVQVLTSDSKKNWGFESYAEALNHFKITNPKSKIFSLGAESEAQKISEFISICKDKNIEVIPAICSIEGALSILHKARLLLTGDTSIKHLASATECPIVEISIGSSDYRKTGVYKRNSFIVSSKIKCAPCDHRQNCHQSSHLCSESLMPEAVGILIHQVLNGTKREIEMIAKEYSEEMTISKTYFNHSGFWYARNVAESMSSKDIEGVVKLSSWKLLNQGEHLKLIGTYGSESIKLKAAIKQAFPEANSEVSKRYLMDLEGSTLQNSEKIDKIKQVLKILIKNKRAELTDLKNGYSLLARELSPTFANEMINFCENYSGDATQNFTQLRKYSDIIQNVFNRNQIQLKLLRNMMNQRMEDI